MMDEEMRERRMTVCMYVCTIYHQQDVRVMLEEYGRLDDTGRWADDDENDEIGAVHMIPGKVGR